MFLFNQKLDNERCSGVRTQTHPTVTHSCRLSSLRANYSQLVKDSSTPSPSRKPLLHVIRRLLSASKAAQQRVPVNTGFPDGFPSPLTSDAGNRHLSHASSAASKVNLQTRALWKLSWEMANHPITRTRVFCFLTIISVLRTFGTLQWNSNMTKIRTKHSPRASDVSNFFPTGVQKPFLQ